MHSLHNRTAQGLLWRVVRKANALRLPCEDWGVRPETSFEFCLRQEVDPDHLLRANLSLATGVYNEHSVTEALDLIRKVGVPDRLVQQAVAT